MGKLAFLFAGQGAQTPGMGQSLFPLPGADAAFAMAEALRPGTQQDCFAATPQRLAQTEVTQPCVFTVDLAAAQALVARGVSPQGAAGFSLGELPALTLAGAFSPEEGFRLVCRRGQLMANAARQNPGSMAAVLKLSAEETEALCARFSTISPVNYNCPGQLVVAGGTEEMPAFCDAVKQAGGMARPLAVSGAFHSPFMRGAATEFAALLQQTGMAAPTLPVYANLTGKPYAPPLAQTLANQIQSPVRWQATIQNMAADGFDTFIEVGPGKTLTGLAKRIVPGARLFNVQDEESLNQTLQAL